MSELSKALKEHSLIAPPPSPELIRRDIGELESATERLNKTIDRMEKRISKMSKEIDEMKYKCICEWGDFYCSDPIPIPKK